MKMIRRRASESRFVASQCLAAFVMEAGRDEVHVVDKDVLVEVRIVDWVVERHVDLVVDRR